MIAPKIPDALRICGDCGEDVCWSGEYCAECQQIREFQATLREYMTVQALEHAARANHVFHQLPRQTGRMPEDTGVRGGAVARSINAFFTWMDGLSPKHGLALFALALAMSWLAIGWVVGRFTQ
jgi:hypothetical protein